MVKMFHVLFYLLVGHAVADYALQSSWMATHKNRHVKLSDKRDEIEYNSRAKIWPYVMTAHALIHGGAVALVTGNLLLGVLETILHWGIDFAKCDRWFGFGIDQFLHILCKIVWVLLALKGPTIFHS